MTISAEGVHLAARPSSTSGIVKAVHSLSFFPVISPLFQSPKEQTHKFLIDKSDEAWLDEVGMVELSMGATEAGDGGGVAILRGDWHFDRGGRRGCSD